MSNQQAFGDSRDCVLQALQVHQALSSSASRGVFDGMRELLDMAVMRKRKRDDIESASETRQMHAYLESLPREQPHVLRDWQQPHFDRMSAMVDRFGVAIDRTKMGMGKTTISLLLAKHKKVDGVVVVHPAGALSLSWRVGARREGVHLVADISWHGLPGNKAHGPSHGWLDRNEIEQTYQDREGQIKSRTIVTYKATQKLVDLVHQKAIAFVFDETQSATNGGDRCKACSAIADVVLPNGPGGKRTNKSWMVFLSGTMADEDKHITAVFQNIGLLPQHFGDVTHAAATTDRQGNTHARADLLGLRDFCVRLEAEADTTEQLWQKWIEKRGTIQELSAATGKPMVLSERVNRFVFEAWRHVLMPTMSSIMVDPHPTYTTTISNVFYRFQKQEDQKRFIAAVQTFERAASAFCRGEKNSAGHLKHAHMEVEMAQVPLVVEGVRMHLTRNPHGKCDVAVQYVDTLAALMRELADYAPMKFSGDPSLSPQQKDELCRRYSAAVYTADGVLTDRLLLANMLTIGEGNNLHDTTGLHPRVRLGSPSFYGRGNAQWATRASRTGAVGPVEVEWVYGSTGEEDERCYRRNGQLSPENKLMRIMRSLLRKTEVQKANWGETDEAMFADKFACKLQLGDGSVVAVKPLEVVLASQPSSSAWTAAASVTIKRPKLIQQTLARNDTAAADGGDDDEQRRKKARLVYRQTQMKREQQQQASRSDDVIMLDSD